MGKRKITPLLVATILTAGIATGAHSLTLQEASSHAVINRSASRNKKNDIENENGENASLAKKNETIKKSFILSKNSSNTLNKNVKSTTNSQQKKKINNTVASSTENTSNNNIASQTYNTPVNKEVQKAAPTHKVMPKQSLNTVNNISSNNLDNNVQTKAKVNNQNLKQTNKNIAVTTTKNTNIISNLNNSNQVVNNKLSLPEGNLFVNGTKIASQLQSDSAIATTAKELTSNCTNDYQKAQAIYVWVARNMYYSKAEENAVLNGSTSTNCGAIHAFNSREGICEDFSTLYAVMANEAGLTTRVVAGQGYGNGQWVSHAWNQVYIPSMGWINVDTTFANSYVTLINANNLPFNSAGILSNEPYYTYRTSEYSYKIYTEDYFNNSNFNSTHRDAEVLAQLGTI